MLLLGLPEIALLLPEVARFCTQCTTVYPASSQIQENLYSRSHSAEMQRCAMFRPPAGKPMVRPPTVQHRERATYLTVMHHRSAGSQLLTDEMSQSFPILVLPTQSKSSQNVERANSVRSTKCHRCLKGEISDNITYVASY